MAFSSLPKVDQSAVNSETSIRKFQAGFNMQNQFICRSEQPDNGIDYEVELIINGNESSGWKFPVQLKSVAAAFNTVNDGTMVSYAFETSRLGYLMRRLPAMGLIFLYSDQEDKLVYEYVDRIYERIMLERESDDWKAKDTVAIHIPIENVVDTISVQDIHKTFLQRFEQSELMQASQGPKYNLPAGQVQAEDKFDINSSESIKKLLLKHGLTFLNNYDMRLAFDLLSRLTNDEIFSEDVLLTIASVAYCQAGRHAESVLYLNKLKRRNSKKFESEMTLHFVQLQNDLALGNIPPADFLNNIKKLKAFATEEKDQLTLAINSAFYQLLQIKALHPIPAELYKEVEDIFESIKNSKIDEKEKYLLKLWNAENFSLIANGITHRMLSELRILESMGGEYTMEEKRQKITAMMAADTRFGAILEEINQYAKKFGNKLVQAHVWAVHNRYRYAREIDFFAFKVPQQTEDHRKILENNIILGLQAYNLYIELNHMKDAYLVLCNAIELIEISRRICKFADKFTLEEFYQYKENLENNFDTPPYKITTPSLVQNIDHSEPDIKNPKTLSFLKELDDTQINTLAKVALTNYKLPPERLVNIVQEMRSYRTFFQRNLDDTLELIQVFPYPGAVPNTYDVPAKFYIKSKSTGLQSVESSNVDELLKAWNY